MSAEPATPRPAATVILLRGGSGHDAAGLELLLLRRGTGARFMPGVWVFAGGVVDPEDRKAARVADQGAFTSTPMTIDEAELAHRIAGARELAEEAAVELNAAELIPWSRWITPTPVPARFDTRFYVAGAPAHCSPEPDGVEMDEARWLTPADALEAGEQDRLELSFPTVRQLEDLSRFPGPKAVLSEARSRAVEAILPRITGTRENFSVLLPGEPGYDDAT